jgi:hypothetical protein
VCEPIHVPAVVAALLLERRSPDNVVRRDARVTVTFR